MDIKERIAKNRQIARTAELTVIGYIYSRPEKAQSIVSSVDPNSFINEDTREFYQVIRSSVLMDRDPVMAIKEYGSSAVFTEAGEIVSQASTTQSALFSYVNDIKKFWKREQLYRIIEKRIEMEVKDPDLELSTIQAEVIDISSKHKAEDSSVAEALKLYEELKEAFNIRKNNGNEILGIPTGYSNLDNAIDGLRPGHFWAIGGYTSAGKTTFCLNIACNIIKHGKRIVFYSLEMSKVDIIAKMIGILANVNPRNILKDTLSQEEHERVEIAKQMLLKSNSSIYADMHNLDKIKLSMMEEVLKNNVDAFFLDYAQLVQSDDKSNYDTLRKTSVELQSLAKRLNIPIVMLSQISNDAARNPDPSIIGFKGAGEIAASSDISIELKSDEPNAEERSRKFREGEPVAVKAYIKKNRHGPVGDFDLTFNTSCGVFTINNDYDLSEF